MCLSTAYKIIDGEESLACENVTAINTDEGVVRLTDIMGNEITVEGLLKSIDLVKNVVRIEV